jgi:CBS-domain-containing membrane protein
MDPNPTVLYSTDQISTAMQYIMEHRYRNLPVVDNNRRFQGIVGINCLLRLALPKAVIMEYGLDSGPFIKESLADLRRRFEAVKNESISICLERELTVVRPDTPLLETLLILYRTRASLPVVEPQTHRLAGMISYWDASQKILEAPI